MYQARSLTLVGRLWLKLSMASLLALFCRERVLSAARGLWGLGAFLSPLWRVLAFEGVSKSACFSGGW